MVYDFLILVALDDIFYIIPEEKYIFVHLRKQTCSSLTEFTQPLKSPYEIYFEDNISSFRDYVLRNMIFLPTTHIAIF